jgi:phosphopantetheinyl transferase (holo-ACP synthase)
MSGVLYHEFENIAGAGIVSWMSIQDEKAFEKSSLSKQVENEAMELLIKETMGTGFTMEKDAFGKPWLVNKTGYISISHSANWVAFCFHPNQPMGIDIETTRLQLTKVAPRVLHHSELSILEKSHYKQRTLQLFWGGKEALYKAYGKKNLEFSTQLVLSEIEDESDSFRGEIILQDSIWKSELSLIMPDEMSYLVYTNELNIIYT